MIGDEIRVVVVHGPSLAGYNQPLVAQHFIRPKDRFFERLMEVPSPKLATCSLQSVFSGHSMRVLDEGYPAQKTAFPKWFDWTFQGLEETLFGNAVIYGVVNSQPASATVSVAQVRAALVELG